MVADTIAALATAPGKGALAVIRISGPSAFAVFGACIAERARFESSWDRRVGLYRFVDGGQKIDQVTAVRYASPRSYTGEDMVEVFTHGGHVVPQLVLGALVRGGARLAEPGEFSRRAVLAGKMDLLSAEAVNAIVASTGAEEHSRAFRAYTGVQRRALRELKVRLESLAAGLEAHVEFELIEGTDATEARRQLVEIHQELESELERWKRASARERDGGAQIVLAGLANAGKSTLFNLLLGRDRAMVDHRAGTTRDYLVEPVLVGGRVASLVDTAGFGSGGDEMVERGIARTREMIEDAEIVVWVSPQNVAEVSEEEQWLLDKCKDRSMIIVGSKADLHCTGGRDSVVATFGDRLISGNLTEPASATAVQAGVFAQVEKQLGESWGLSLVVNERHAEGIRAATTTAAELLRESNAREDALASGVRTMVREIGVICGEEADRDVMELVFRGFCVGK